MLWIIYFTNQGQDKAYANLFGKIKKGTISDPQKVTIINAGKKDMEITFEMMGYDRSDFSHTHDCLGQLPPGTRVPLPSP
ncbi:MAG: hypothetical protein MZV70_62130 [Desulfobacterales bacterium]|nr:hypothetical protein [Desulfobacterales bacterium]